jgi:hypothetical protein
VIIATSATFARDVFHDGAAMSETPHGSAIEDADAIAAISNLDTGKGQLGGDVGELEMG